MPERLIKIFGERNTGTNLLRQILSRNSSAALWPGTIRELGQQYETEVIERSAAAGFNAHDDFLFKEYVRDEIFDRDFDLTLGWKHAAPSVDRIKINTKFQDTLFLIISKNPYAWLLSTYRRPYHNLIAEPPLSFETFLRRPWLTVRRDNAPLIFETPVALWNYKYRLYIEFAREANVRFITYEDILSSPEVVLSICDISSDADQTLDVPRQSLKGDAQTFDSYKEMYQNKFWAVAIERKDIEVINAGLDRKVMKCLAYSFEPT